MLVRFSKVGCEETIANCFPLDPECAWQGAQRTAPQEGLRPAKRYLKASGREQEGLRVSAMTPLFDKILNLKNSTLVEDTEEMVKSN